MKLKSPSSSKRDKVLGYTLIELVVVIIIIGVLAVTAAPKFIDLKIDANNASLQGVKATLESSIDLVYAKAVIENKHNLAAGTTAVQINGSPLSIKYGYPLADYSKSASTGSWDDIIDIDENSFSTHVIGGIRYFYIGDTEPSNIHAKCMVYYQMVNTLGTDPIIHMNEC